MRRAVAEAMTGNFDFETFPVLSTERLILRELKASDAEAVMKIRGDYEVTKYNTGEAYEFLWQAQDLIAGIAAEYSQKRELRWGITLRQEDTVIGLCGFNYWSRRDHRASIGYDLARAHWGKGIMPEALTAVLEFGYTRMGLNRIEADTSIYNVNSQQVLRKLGFQQEGHQREQYYENGAYHDLLLFSLLKREFAFRK
jgi:[ribosomal protein S5]-alanine N-acetyltransferase